MVGGTKPRFRKHVEKEREDARAWCSKDRPALDAAWVPVFGNIMLRGAGRVPRCVRMGRGVAHARSAIEPWFSLPT
jgi:hypothetical protein